MSRRVPCIPNYASGFQRDCVTRSSVGSVNARQLLLPGKGSGFPRPEGPGPASKRVRTRITKGFRPLDAGGAGPAGQPSPNLAYLARIQGLPLASTNHALRPRPSYAPLNDV